MLEQCGQLISFGFLRKQLARHSLHIDEEQQVSITGLQ